MTPIYLKLNFESLTGGVTLVQVYHDEPVTTGEIQSFSRARRQQLTLTPRLRKLWPEFLKLLPGEYGSDRFLLDFQGPRSEFERLLAYRETLKNSLGADISFRYRGSEPEALKKTDYRRRRLTSINREIQSGKYPALADPELLKQFQDLIYHRLDRILTAPNDRDWAAMEALSRTAEHCLKESSKPADLLTADLELVQRLQGYRAARKVTVGDILARLESLGDTVRCCDFRPLWQECCMALEDLTARLLMAEENPEDSYAQFIWQWLDRFDETIGGFGRHCNGEIQSLYRIDFWRTSILLEEDYPLFSRLPEAAAGIYGYVTEDRKADIHRLRDHALAMLRRDFDRRTQVLDRERAAFLEKNAENIRVLTRDADTTGKMLTAGENQLKSLGRDMDAENRQLLAASAIMDEVRILLTGTET